MRRSWAVRTRVTWETAVVAWPDLNEARCAHLVIEVNHHAQRISHYGQVGEDAGRPEERVPVTGDYLDFAEALYGGLEFAVEVGKCRWRPLSNVAVLPTPQA